MNKLSYTPAEDFKGSFTTMQLYLIDFYIHWLNNYLTIERLAEHNELSVELCAAMIKEGKELQKLYSEQYSYSLKAKK